MERLRTVVVPALIALAVSASAAQEPAGAHLLFDFEHGAKGWHANVYGKGKMWAEAAAEAKVGRGAIAVHFQNIKGANLISPAIAPGEEWHKRRYDRVRFWARPEQPMTQAQIVFNTDEAEHNTYSLHFPMETTGWQRHTYPLTRCWNRGKKGLDASRIKRIYVTGSGTMAFALDHLELLEAGREVFLEPDRHAFVIPTATPPEIDGQLGDAAWRTATRLAPFLRYGTDKPAADQTEAWVTHDASALYIAARLHTKDPSKLKAVETARDAAVWRDDCIEVFIDSQHTHTECYQFVANSIGSQLDLALPGGQAGRGLAWNGKWTVKAAVSADSWTVEMRIPFADLGQVPKPGDSWGFNVCREAPSTGELSYWTNTGGRFTRVRGMADLVFAGRPHAAPAVTNVRLEEKSPGAYILRADTKADKATDAAYVVWAQTPDDARPKSQGHAAVAAGEGDLAVPVEFEAKEEGEAKLWFVLKDRNTDAIVAYGAYSFNVSFPSQADLSKLVLVPTPKELKLAEGAFAVNADTTISTGSDPRERTTAALVQQELQECYGARTAVRSDSPVPDNNVILVGRPETCPRLKQALEKLGLVDRLAALKPEGYVLVVAPKQVLIAGRDNRGTYYAARTFLQLIANASPEGQPARARCCTIVDWPDFPFRGYMIYTSGWPQDPLDKALLKELIYEEVAGYKYNAIVWQMKAGYQYSRRPRLRNRCALPRETVRDVAQFARDHFIELIPNTNILGHANWIVLKYKELQEDGKPHQFCTRHPMTYPLLFDVMEEMLDVFDHPKRLHVGLDEVRWKTFNLPEDQRCPRCRGAAKWQIYADHINKLHAFLKSKGVEVWMWGDMLLTRHNGGPPFDCHRALDLIPKDVVICNWSADYAKGSSKELVDKGFRVVKSNSRQVPLSEQPYVFGNLASFWYRQPWCVMSHVGERGLMMDTAYAAEYSWNVNRENVTLQQYKRQSDLNVLRLVARPKVPRGGAAYTPVDLSEVANRAVADEAAGDGKGWADLGPERDLRALPGGDVQVGAIAFRPVGGKAGAKRAVYLTKDTPRVGPIAVSREVESVAFLHAAVFPADTKVRKAYLKRFLAPVDGLPVVTYRVMYANGQAVDLPIRVGMDVGHWLPTRDGEYLHRCPYICRLATEHCRKTSPGATDVALYAYEWPNPHPDWCVDAIELSHKGDEAAYALLALSTRAPR